MDGLRHLIADVFAPMIHKMKVDSVSITENGAIFSVPENPFLARCDGIVCGQAIASIAEPVGVLALFAHNSPQRLKTTVDMAFNFLRPMQNCALDLETIILSNGKRMAIVRIEINIGFSKLKQDLPTTLMYVDTQ